MRMLDKYGSEILTDYNKNLLVPLEITKAFEWMNQLEKPHFDIERDFPNALSPWSLAWYEWYDKRSISGGFGVYWIQTETRNIQADHRGEFCFFDGLPKVVIDGSRWVFTAVIYAETGDELDLMGFYAGTISENGSIMPYRSTWEMTQLGTRLLGWNVEQKHSPFLSIFMLPCYFANSLLHCKNVETTNSFIPRHERRRLEREGKPPAITYKTLVVDPMKKQVRKERQKGDSDIQRALHICRAHFREYTEDKPLFGKVTGRFWIPQHIRGDEKYGKVIKNYKIKGLKDANQKQS